MRLLLLGTGATQTIPRPCCDCEICKEAREKNEAPYKRTGPSLFIKDVNILIDTPPGVNSQLNREGIDKVERVFYTHWHPDHTMGMTVFHQITWNYEKGGPEKKINVFFPPEVFEDLKGHKMSGPLEYYENQEMIETKNIKGKGSIILGDITIKPVKVSEENVWAYSIENKNKKVLYAPCDIDDLPVSSELKDYDLFILEFGHPDLDRVANPEEITDFYETIDKVKELDPRKVIFTHIEENRRMSPEDLKELSNEFEQIDMEFAYDGMEISL